MEDQDLTNEEVNRYIHEEIMGESTGFMEYCSSDSPRSLLEGVLNKVNVDHVSLYLNSFPRGLRSTAEELARAIVDADRETKALKKPVVHDEDDSMMDGYPLTQEKNGGIW